MVEPADRNRDKGGSDGPHGSHGKRAARSSGGRCRARRPEDNARNAAQERGRGGSGPRGHRSPDTSGPRGRAYDHRRRRSRARRAHVRPPSQAGRICRAGARGVEPDRWALLDRARLLRPGPDLRARRRAHRPGTPGDPSARARARPLAGQPAVRAEINGTEPLVLLRRRAVHVRRGHGRPQGGLAEAPQRTSPRRAIPTLFDSFTQRGFELDHMSIVDWIEESVPGGVGLEARPAARHRLQHRVRRRVGTSRARSTSCTCSGSSGQGQFRIFGKSNEKYHVRGGNDQITIAAWQRQLAGQITTGSELVAVIRRTPSGCVHADVQAGVRDDDRHRGQARPRAAVLDPAPLGGPLAGGLLGAQAAGDRTSRAWARTRSSTSSSPRRHWNGLGSNGDTISDTGYQNTWEVSRAQPGTAGILVDYTGGDIGASFGSGTPAQSRAAVPRSDRAGAARDHVAILERPRDASTYWPGNAWTRGLVLVLEGRPVHRVRRDRGVVRRATRTSAASTPRSTSRAT